MKERVASEEKRKEEGKVENRGKSEKTCFLKGEEIELEHEQKWQRESKNYTEERNNEMKKQNGREEEKNKRIKANRKGVKEFRTELNDQNGVNARE